MVRRTWGGERMVTNMGMIRSFIQDYIRLMAGRPLGGALPDRSRDELDARRTASRFSRGNVSVQDDRFASWAAGEFDERRAAGGRLTASDRNALPADDFALPGRRYPINDASHARNALARVSQNGSPAEKSKVRAVVRRKYPDIGETTT